MQINTTKGHLYTPSRMIKLTKAEFHRERGTTALSYTTAGSGSCEMSLGDWH